METRFFLNDPLAPRPNQPRRLGAIAALLRDSSVLLEHRADSNVWTFIGGRVEDTESLEAGLRREVLEETGFVELEELHVAAIFSSPGRIVAYPDGNVVQIVTVAFVARCPFGPPTVSAESTALEFIPFEALPDWPIAPTHRPFADFLYGQREVGFTHPALLD